MVVLPKNFFVKMLFVFLCATNFVAHATQVPSNKKTAALVLAGAAAVAARGATENHPEYHGMLKCYPMIFATSLAAIVVLDRWRTGGWYLLRDFATSMGLASDATKAIYTADVNTEFAYGEDEDFFGSDDDGDDDDCGGCCCCH